MAASKLAEEINETRKQTLRLKYMPELGKEATKTREIAFHLKNTPGIVKELNMNWGKHTHPPHTKMKLGVEGDIFKTKDGLTKLMHSKTHVVRV
jgi:hypothetical protein